MTFVKMIGAALCGTILVTAPTFADPVETASAAGKDASWLIIQTASEVRFDGKILTLKNVDPSVVMFTNRPARMAEAIPTATFVASWDKCGAKSFKSDPPNAALTSIVDGKLQTATLELSEPRLDGPDLTFEVRLIGGTVSTVGKTVSLFIDKVCWTCTG